MISPIPPLCSHVINNYTYNDVPRNFEGVAIFPIHNFPLLHYYVTYNSKLGLRGGLSTSS